jgi:hypothetical protein
MKRSTDKSLNERRETSQKGSTQRSEDDWLKQEGSYDNIALKELLSLAKERGIDVTGCVEKSDIIENIRLSKLATPVRITKQATAQSIPGQRSKAVARAAPVKPESHVATAQSTPGEQGKAAARAAPVKPESRAEVDESPSRSGAWSERIQHFFLRFPGFTATLPAEAEMWTAQELEVYFGSDGGIWPRGKRPSWFNNAAGRCAQSFENSGPKPAPRKTYPDLKEHFETLDLPETVDDAGMIRRQYRRLARDSHPDKNPHDAEGARQRFQAINAAYEAIRDRLKL